MNDAFDGLETAEEANNDLSRLDTDCDLPLTNAELKEEILPDWGYAD